jgi:hypothetical protein
MASNVTMTVYLGSGEKGSLKDAQIIEAANKKGMTKSEFVLYCVDTVMKIQTAQEGAK